MMVGHFAVMDGITKSSNPGIKILLSLFEQFGLSNLTTSMEHPMRAPLFRAFVMMINIRFGIPSVKSYTSVTPPVKSSIASEEFPPFRASYEPNNLG